MYESIFGTCITARNIIDVSSSRLQKNLKATHSAVCEKEKNCYIADLINIQKLIRIIFFNFRSMIPRETFNDSLTQENLSLNTYFILISKKKQREKPINC